MMSSTCTAVTHESCLTEYHLQLIYTNLTALVNNHNHMQKVTELRMAVVLTEALLSQVHIDDKEHEPSGSFFLPSNKSIHPA